MSKLNIGFGITGSFCTHALILNEIKKLVEKGYNIIPILTDNVLSTSTRFGTASDFVSEIENITNNKVVSTIVEAEPIGPKNLIDILVIAPTTGNTLGKLANAITDNAVTMVFKAHVRNNKPVVIGISSNDALGLNLKNIATLLNTKNIYFVPFTQDDPIKKPKSLIADYSKIEETIERALKGEQIQPLLIKENKEWFYLKGIRQQL